MPAQPPQMMKLTRHSRAHSRHSRAGGNPGFAQMLDSHLRGNDETQRFSR